MLNQFSNTALIRRTPTEKAGLAAFGIFFIYYIVKAVYFAISVNENIFPDEVTWFGICKIFSQSLLPPADSPESYQYGLITRKPMLYFFLMGKILSLNIFPISDLIFLRFINIFLGCLTVLYAWETASLLIKDQFVQVLSIILLTNTMMFTFMTGAVNYDNLTNLLAILALYYLFAFLKNRQTNHFLFFSVFLLLGGLTKISFLPYAFLLVVAVIFHERKNFPKLLPTVTAWFSQFKRGKITLSLLCLMLLIANLHLYLGNIIKYKRLEPRIHQVLSLDQALQFRLFARGYIVNKYRGGEITLRQAQIMAIQLIKHEGDRADTLDLLQRAAMDKKQQLPRLNRFQYILPWLQLMSERTYGIAAHKLMPKGLKALIPYYLIAVLSLFLFFRKLKTTDMLGKGKYLLFISFGYVLILMQLVNYKHYAYAGAIGSALTGRYLFPVIVPIYILVSYYLLKNSTKWWRWSILLFISFIFVLGEFPWFINHATQDWFF